MSRSDPTEAGWIGLALVDPLSFNQALVDELREAGVSATFFVRPDVLILDSVRWRFVLAAGHELGNGCLLGVTDDGRLPNWTYATIEAELRDSTRLLADLGQEGVASIYLPGHFDLCAEGRYRRKLQASFEVCLGDSKRSASFRGVTGAFALGSTPDLPTGPISVVRARPDDKELRQFLIDAQGCVIGPVSDLAKRNPHT